MIKKFIFQFLYMVIINLALGNVHGVFDNVIEIKRNTQKTSVYPLVINLDCELQKSGIFFVLVDNTSGYIGVSNGSNNFFWAHFSKAPDCYEFLAEVFYSNPYRYNLPLKLQKAPSTYEEWLKMLDNSAISKKAPTNVSTLLITVEKKQKSGRDRGYSFG